MATERKVNNLTALAVLSTLTQRPMHRYEIASVLKAHGKDVDMNIKWSSLYTVVQNLARHGLLEAVGTSRQGGRPERTVYQITDAGRAEMLDWTRELLATPEREHPTFAAALSIQMVLPPDEVLALLRTRLGALDASIADQRAELDRLGREIPRLFLVEAEYVLAMTAAERVWVAALVDDLTAGTFPDLDAWRTMHAEGGDMPPELVELHDKGVTPN
jgi:DNA-binding PadR family transcriptional regulator